MSLWSIAAAQYAVRQGGLEANIEHHLCFIEHAALENVNLLIFPEFSLCSDNDADATQFAMTLHSSELDPLSDAARQFGMTVVTGLPHLDNNAHNARAVIFMPDGSRQSSRKPALEKSDWFTPCPATPIHGKMGRYFALGVNTSSDDEALPRSAAGLGANLYITGRHTPVARWQHDSMYLQQWAHKYNIAVLMANQTCNSGRWHSTGHSACWDERGQLIIRAEAGELLVIGRRSGAGWQGEVIPVR